jgi:carbon-monoxide dehydrogenase large subunit
MPRGHDLPKLDMESAIVPTRRNRLGVKGARESGTCNALPTSMNAVNDVHHSIGASLIEMPATQERVWRAILAGGQ